MNLYGKFAFAHNGKEVKRWVEYDGSLLIKQDGKQEKKEKG
jgi:hypothetical protein